MLRSTFLGYKTATSALKVNQNMMDVVGQNISNINTEGYTRQRLDINSVSFSSSNIKFGTDGVIIGQGVSASGVSQYRDSFLDLRYRTQAAKTGSEDVQLEALSDLESVLDEISADGLDAQFSDLVEQLHSLTSAPSDPVIEGVVRTSAEMLTQMFNDYSKQIDTIKSQQFSYLENGALEKVNQLTENIARLNKQIKEDNISNNPALELNDERNMLIDELSNYLDIEVKIDPMPIGGNKTIDVLSIELGNSKIKLVDNDKFVELDALEEKNGIKIFMTKNLDGSINVKNDPDTLLGGDEKKYLTNLIGNGQIDGYLKFLNGKGEFATSADTYQNSKVKGVQYYQSMLDTLANKFATVMNAINKDVLKNTNKPLFDSRNEIYPVTAGNISIHKNWADSTGSYITNTTVNASGDTTEDTTGATDNILRMISKFQNSEDFKASTGIDENNNGTIEENEKTKLFSGTFQEFLSYTTTKLNLQVADVQTSYDTYSKTQYQIDYARSSLSSVDLNEEGVNLLTYSKSYNAAARLMTTLDEMLNTLINEMAR